MELEKLLMLLQAYGVTSYADKEVKLELAPAIEMPDEEFGVDFSAIRFTEDDIEEPN